MAEGGEEVPSTGHTRREVLRKGLKLARGAVIATSIEGIGIDLVWNTAIGRSMVNAGLDLFREAGASFRDEDAEDRIRRQMEEKVVNPVPEDGPFEEKELAGLRVILNKDGLPIKFITPDGREKRFDLNQVLSARERARVTQETELVSVVEMVPTKVEKRALTEYKGTVEHPKTFELPQDILSEAELHSRGIEIIQGDDVSLFIRQGAFDEGSLLHRFRRSKGKLKIVLVNGSIVDPYFLRDKKYDGVRDRLEGLKGPRRQDVGKARQSEIKYYSEFLVKSRKFLGEDNREFPDRSWGHFRNIAKAKAYIHAYQSLMPDVQVLVAFNAKRPFEDSDATGRYYSNRLNPKRDNIIFSCVGSAQLDTDLAWFYFEPDGKFDFSWNGGLKRALPFHSGFGEPYWEVHNRDTHPDPTTYTFDSNASRDKKRSYPYSGQTPGLVLRHELAHDELIAGNPSNPNHNEYDTDMRAVETIRQAWQRWKDSGFTDDRGYYLVLEDPQVKEYILT